MNHGPETDIRVAEDVMGWKAGLLDGECWVSEHPQIDPDRRFQPSTDIRAAMEVVESREWLRFRLAKKDDLWLCCMTPEWESSAPTAPHAICLAALKAVGDE